ncbi:chloride channel protein [Ethanoligenens harbinense]|uniref:Cl-channel voltage-gated family protein n=1 Tax=Ethanoligenens harbinense (strain DSM 18485 / JCM 12961 / CGMCC 1.5033 / YUAN-3) TaxID=663278 RepID=E6U8M6_ETHHY|nr:chloride channel protein [Ethanoligenens harbinense]ADU26017.1 Cl- channel voltage-gated family protein [Ethanoligenens harbinense YUAN-3]
MVSWRNRILLLLLTAATGVAMGSVSALFLWLLALVTGMRERQPLWIALLPVVGVFTVFLYTRFGKNAQRGNNLIIDSVNENEQVPLRMGIFTFICTVLTQLVGGSVGREGTAVQVGGTIANVLGRAFHLHHPYHRILVMAGISAGFGSVFGMPLAGAVFGMEMCFVGHLGYEALLPCFVASFTADSVTRALGITHETYAITSVPAVGWYSLLVVVIAAMIFGVAGRLFAVAIRALKLFYARRVSHPIPRVLLGSAVLLVAMLALRAVPYAGLSTWMIGAGFAGKAQWYDGPLKLLMTVLSLGAGFQGGEVTPLFDIGAGLGGWLGLVARLSPSLLAALGMISVFGCAANTPLTTLIMGFELFGNQSLPFVVIAVFVSYYVSGRSGIYGAQRVTAGRPFYRPAHPGETLDAAGNRSLTGYLVTHIMARFKKR